jgi:hypothetical protein
MHTNLMGPFRNLFEILNGFSTNILSLDTEYKNKTTKMAEISNEEKLSQYSVVEW